MSEVQLMDVAETSSETGVRLWGPWATAGLGLVILVAYMLSQLPVYIVNALIQTARDPQLDTVKVLQGSASNGTLLSFSLLGSAVIGVVLTTLACVLKRGSRVRDHLAVHSRSRATVAQWAIVALLAAGLSDVVLALFGRPVVPDFMAQAYTTTSLKPLLFLAVVVVSPLFEELFFRGFLFTGFERSRLGPRGAILLTSIVWTGVHLQYGPVELAIVFVLGVILGLARTRSASVVPAIAAHMMVNLVAFIEVVLQYASV